MHVNLEHAEKAIEAARKKAIALKTQMCIAVVDSGANLKAFMRMDDAWVGSIDIAIKKAKTACSPCFISRSGAAARRSACSSCAAPPPARPTLGCST